MGWEDSFSYWWMGDSTCKSPLFTCAEMDRHIANSGKKHQNSEYHSLPTGLRKAKAFLADEYLHEIQTHQDQCYFYYRGKCFQYLVGEVRENCLIQFKDVRAAVRANCFCAFLLRTAARANIHATRHPSSAPSTKMNNDKADGHCYSFA